MAMTQHLWGQAYTVPASTTADDLLRLPDDGFTNELYEGVLVQTMTSPGHGALCHRLSVELGIYARAAQYPNQIVQNSLFDLTQPGEAVRTVLAPDLAIMRTSAPPAWNVPADIPLLAVEVASPTQSLAELAIKAQRYRNVGVAEVWLIDPKQRVIEVWTAAETTRLTESDLLTTPLLPGFSVAVAALLDG